ncbi:MAG: tripartite tricarboxylate transporter substrate binding protein [Betaproteobacteria bacterium]|nr:tripartite tricarboxylate transporter substrate binding protein [Betaproteobacteria bacterium]
MRCHLKTRQLWKTCQLSNSLRSVLTATVAALLPTLAWAQAYPTKPIRIVVPVQAGGGTDLVARIVGHKLSTALGKPVIIDNRPGAGGNIGTELVAKAPADGHTLLVVSTHFVVNPSLYSKVAYDPIKDFESVSVLTTFMLFLVVHPSLPVRSVKALIALAKAQPGHLNYASSGTGTATHIAGELFASMAGVRMTHIPYKGTGPAIPAVIGGQVAIHFGGTAVVPHTKTGKLILLGVTGAKRSPTLPDAPTIAEAGLPGYESTSWNALFAPAGTPVAIVKRISAEVGKGLSQADALEILEKQDLQQAAGTPEELAALVRTEVTKWAKVIRAAGIKPE